MILHMWLINSQEYKSFEIYAASRITIYYDWIHQTWINGLSAKNGPFILTHMQSMGRNEYDISSLAYFRFCWST